MRKAGDRLRITGQLIDSTTGSPYLGRPLRWRARSDLRPAGQGGDDVVGAIAPKVEQAEIDRAKRSPTTSLNAYDHYLRGMAYLPPSSLDAAIEARRLMLKAIELDPEYAIPHAIAPILCHAP